MQNSYMPLSENKLYFFLNKNTNKNNISSSTNAGQIEDKK